MDCITTPLPSHSIKNKPKWIIAFILATFIPMAQSLPFGYEWSEKREDKAQLEIKDKTHKYCSFNDYHDYIEDYFPKLRPNQSLKDNRRDEELWNTVREGLSLLSIDTLSMWGHLKSPVDRKYFIENKSPINFFNIKNDNTRYHETHDYKRKLYIFSELFKTTEFEKFLNYNINLKKIDTAIHKTKRGIVCAQYQNNNLFMISLNRNGFERDFDTIKQSIKDKYSFRKYYTQTKYPKIGFCKNIKSENCFLDIFIATGDRTSIRIEGYSKRKTGTKTYKGAWGAHPSINYYDAEEYANLIETKEEAILEYQLNVMRPIYGELSKLIKKSMALPKGKDFLEQF